MDAFSVSFTRDQLERIQFLIENDDGDYYFLEDVRNKIAKVLEERIPCPICPHWMEYHNPDGTCGCGAHG